MISNDKNTIVHDLFGQPSYLMIFTTLPLTTCVILQRLHLLIYVQIYLNTYLAAFSFFNLHKWIIAHHECVCHSENSYLMLLYFVIILFRF